MEQGSVAALVAQRIGDRVQVAWEWRRASSPPAGYVLVHCQYSDVNFKDALATLPDGGVVRSYPRVLGIDLAGEVEDAAQSGTDLAQGEVVIATGYELGTDRDGGYAGQVVVPAPWLLRAPDGLSAREAMVYGTAGLTAGLSVRELLRSDITRDSGPVLVTGATGGVGMVSVAILAHLGFEVVAATGKPHMTDALLQLGATRVIARDELFVDARPLASARYAAAIDAVGGAVLSRALAQIRRAGVVALSGNVGGRDFEASVYPFILRGVRLIGIDSGYAAADVRRAVWSQLAGDWRVLDRLAPFVREIGRGELPGALAAAARRQATGRTVVQLLRD
jgi:putative YhdH/YhfP family quinone oxidoreductase